MRLLLLLNGAVHAASAFYRAGLIDPHPRPATNLSSLCNQWGPPVATVFPPFLLTLEYTFFLRRPSHPDHGGQQITSIPRMRARRLVHTNSRTACLPTKMRRNTETGTTVCRCSSFPVTTRAFSAAQQDPYDAHNQRNHQIAAAP